MELVALDASACVLRIALGERHWNLARSVHGGVIAALADTAIGLAFVPGLGARGGLVTPTVSVAVDFLERVPAGAAELRTTARVLRAGKRLGFGEADVHADGRLVARAHGTVAMVALKAAP